MKALVTGGAGMLARAVTAELRRGGAEVHAPARRDLDITDPRAVVEAMAAFEPDAVFHLAAYTDVDGAEVEPERAYAVNATATARIARLCGDRGSSLVYPSTDYVFSGSAIRPYRIDDAIAPINHYGASKAAGECAVLAIPRGCVVRTSWLYGKGGGNFVASILQAAREDRPLQVVDDQVGRPTRTGSLARILISLHDQDAEGMFHATAGGQPVSWYGFAREILEAAGVTAEMTPVSSSAYGARAPRPGYSVLDCSRAERSIGEELSDWRTELAAFFHASRG